MHTIARASSFTTLPSGPSPYSYPAYHQPPSHGSKSQSRSEPPTPSDSSVPIPSMAGAYFGTAPSFVGPQQTPARGCLKPPSKEFTTRNDLSEPPAQIAPSPSRSAPGGARRRPNMKLERLPSNAIARIQMAEGVEPHVAEQGLNASSGAKGKCKERVPTPYVKSDKSAWLSDGEE